MAGLVPAIHVLLGKKRKTWMPGTRPGMTNIEARINQCQGSIVENKVAIVTGAGRGIGRAIAMLMAEEGAKVLVNDVGAALDGSGGDTGPAQQVADEIKKKGGQAIASTLSIGEPQSRRPDRQAARRLRPRLDIPW